MPLKAKLPEANEKRLKMLVYGPAGVGKTTAALSFPKAVIIDMEHGTDHYHEMIQKSGSVVLNTTNPDEVRAEVKSLLTEKHEYTTLIVDPITVLYGSIQERWTKVFEKYAKSEKEAELQDFGFRYWAKVKSEYKSFVRMLLALDLNIILTSHQKDLYGAGMQRVGVGPDSAKGDEYIFDLVFQLDSIGGKRIAKTIKERAPLGKNKFPPEFQWNYENFRKFYGAEAIERESKPVQLASPEQIAEISRLIEIVKMDESEISAWFTKADVSSWEEMTSETVNKCIAYVQKKLEPVKGAH